MGGHYEESNEQGIAIYCVIIVDRLNLRFFWSDRRGICDRNRRNVADLQLGIARQQRHRAGVIDLHESLERQRQGHGPLRHREPQDQRYWR